MHPQCLFWPPPLALVLVGGCNKTGTCAFICDLYFMISVIMITLFTISGIQYDLIEFMLCTLVSGCGLRYLRQPWLGSWVGVFRYGLWCRPSFAGWGMPCLPLGLGFGLHPSFLG